MCLLRCGVQELDPGALKKIAQTSTANVASSDDVWSSAPTNALMAGGLQQLRGLVQVGPGAARLKMLRKTTTSRDQPNQLYCVRLDRWSANESKRGS